MAKAKFSPGYRSIKGLEVIQFIGTRKNNGYYRCVSPCSCKKIIEIGCSYIKKQKYCNRQCPEFLQKHSDIKTIDLSGKKFEKLTVIGLSDKEDPFKNKYWNCICQCGNKVVVSTTNLNTKHTTSCGCAILKFSSDKERILSHTFTQIKTSAKRRNILFEITKEDFESIAFLPCYLCGEFDTKGCQNIKIKTLYFDNLIKIQMNGIDRIINEKGYIKNNIKPCCSTCNLMKLDHSKTKFLEQIKKILKYNNYNISEASEASSDLSPFVNLICPAIS